MRGYCALEVVVGDKRWMAMRGEKKKKKKKKSDGEDQKGERYLL
jgi:hypothetical protein